uniref:Pentatricopeptide repeat-containing protein n=1 Tax=Kalanchoe fedtschenkoi TaxID=63787 RepID=A0A7N0THN5_KALFE
MAVRWMASRFKSFRSHLHFPNHPSINTSTQFSAHAIPSKSDHVNEISRLLSDYRDPTHDLESRLPQFSSEISADLVEQVLKRCKNLGFSAYRFFNWAKTLPHFRPTSQSCHILVDVLGSSKQFPFLWDFLIEARDSGCCEICPKIFWIVFWSYSRANLPNDAIRAFGRMAEFGVEPSCNDLDQLLYALCKRKHVEEAKQYFDLVKLHFAPTAKTYSILIRGLGDIGDSGNARKLFDEMVERGCSVDVPACNSLFEAMCKGGEMGEAYKLLGEMGSKGLEPDACTYATFIRAACEANDLHSAFRMLDRMKRHDLAPNVFTYNYVIKKLCADARVDEAYQLLGEMVEMGVTPDLWSHKTILAYHCDHSEVNKALKLVALMEKDNCVPDTHMYNMILKLLIRVGRFDRMEALWLHTGDRGFYPSVSTYSVMVHGLCRKKGKLEDACKYFEMMIDEGIPPYHNTVEMLRNKLVGFGLTKEVQILSDKMGRSSSCTIQELATVMRGNKEYVGRRCQEMEWESDSET